MSPKPPNSHSTMAPYDHCFKIWARGQTMTMILKQPSSRCIRISILKTKKKKKPSKPDSQVSS